MIGNVRQTPIEVWIYVAIFGIIGFFILLCIGCQVWKAVLQNPAEVIKNRIIINGDIMITHYLKVAFRNLVKYKNADTYQHNWIIGWFLLALRFPYYGFVNEMTYDNFHEGADRIYLAGDKFDLQGDGFSYYSSSLLADYIMKNCPEVEKACHIIQKT